MRFFHTAFAVTLRIGPQRDADQKMRETVQLLKCAIRIYASIYAHWHT